MSKRLAWLAPVIAVGLAGCVGTTTPSFTSVGPATGEPTNFNAFGEEGIATSELAPPSGPVVEGVYGPVPPPVEDTQPVVVAAPEQIAALPESDVTIGIGDLPGGWTISVDGGACPLSLTETPWEGGFRASTRSCQSDALKSISSWRLDGQQVVLYAGDSVVARLRATSIFRDGNIVTNGRFEGQLAAGGIPVSFFR